MPPAVLHLVRRWGVPSERFVSDLVRTSTATRPYVVAVEPGSAPADGVALVDVATPARRLPATLAARVPTLAGVAVGARRRAVAVHAHFAHCAPAGLRIARLLRRPLLVSVHGHDVLVEAGPAGFWPALRAAQRVIVPSAFLADRVADEGVERTRIAVLPAGVDLAEHPHRAPHAPDGAATVTFVGRFVEKKGVLDLLEAAAIARGEGVDLRLRLVGYGPLEAEVRAAAAGGRATVVDGRDRATVLAELDRADIVATPSRTAVDGDAETLCVVNLEAQARGIPVLTTRHGGIPEHVAPGAGVIVPEADPPALAAALQELVAHPENWAAMGTAGRGWIEGRYRLADTTAAVEALTLATT